MKKIIFYGLLCLLHLQTIRAESHIPIVDFDSSMLNSKGYNKSFSINDLGWKNAKSSFDTHVVYNQKYQERVRIPKIIHQIWVGPNPFPERYKVFQKSWLEKHPDWQYILWTNELIEQFHLRNKMQYDATSNYGQKADIARYEILDRLGGLYIDTDFECLKPFDAIHHCCDFYAGVTSGPGFEVYNGLIGSIPGHPILKSCIDEINTYTKENLSRENFSSDPMDIIRKTGPIFFTKQIEKYFSLTINNIVLFPITYFYPWPNYERDNTSNIKKWFRPESYAVHHWHTAWAR